MVERGPPPGGFQGQSTNRSCIQDGSTTGQGAAAGTGSLGYHQPCAGIPATRRSATTVTHGSINNSLDSGNSSANKRTIGTSIGGQTIHTN